MLSSACSRWAWLRWASVAFSSSPAACPTDLVRYLVRYFACLLPHTMGHDCFETAPGRGAHPA
jgi:hypothetical protein